MRARMLNQMLTLLAMVPAGLAGTAFAAESEVDAQLEHLPPVTREAIERFARTDLEEWHYQRTRHNEEGVLVDRHDPSLPGAEHWQLVSIDGREPTLEERRDYEKGRADHSQDEEKAVAERITAMLAPGSVIPSAGPEGEQRFAYRMQSPDGKHERVFQAMEGELVIADDADAPWIRTVHAWNHETFRPVLGLRIDEARLRFDFMIQDGWVLPVTAEAQWNGALLMLKDIDRRMRFTMSDYRRLPETGKPALAASP